MTGPGPAAAGYKQSEMKLYFAVLLSLGIIFQEGMAFIPAFGSNMLKYGTNPSSKISAIWKSQRNQIPGTFFQLKCQLRSGGPPMDNEPLDLSEETVKQALTEAKEVHA